MEHERKLEARIGFVLPELGGKILEPRVFTSVYYDSPDRSLAQAGIVLRRRLERGRSLWQLKLPVNGVRIEREEPGGPGGPPAPLCGLLKAHERRGALAPVGELRTRRYGELVARRRLTAEVTVDEVAVMDAQRVTAEFVEIDVTMRDGEPAGLKQIAKELERAGAHPRDLTPELARVREREARGASPRTPFEALKARLRRQLDEILAKDPPTRLGDDPESLHDMRVAVRRARALLRAGRSLFATDTQMLEQELRWLGGVLGDVRDLDVLLDHLRREASALDPADREAARGFLLVLDRQRARARRALMKALDAERYVHLLDGFEDTLDELEPSGASVPLARLAARELDKLRRDVHALGDAPTDEGLHSLRKRAKRTRYTQELAGAERLAERAKALQGVLGEHQDSVVAEERLRALSEAASPEQAVAAGRLVERERVRRAQARESWRCAWRRVERAR